MNILKTLMLLLAITFFAGLPQLITIADEENKQVNWREWEEGFEEASEKDMILLLSVYTDWCGWCRRMDNNTFANEDIIEMIHENFIPVKFNPENEGTYSLHGQDFTGPELLGILMQGQRTGYPTTLFLVVDDRRVYPESGYQDPDRFAQTLSNILAKEKEKAGE